MNPQDDIEKPLAKRAIEPRVGSLPFVRDLLDWYERHKRPLPWRADRDPYKIWLSEIILQQTRVVQGLPYYERFLQTYPTVHHLAKATEQDVLHLWQGLGYYSRARHLHACSQEVVGKLGGHFPRTYKALLKLPGIGPYTAAAIASIAFEERVAVVDGNVYRVLARLFGIEEDIGSGKGQKVFRQQAEKLVPKRGAGDYNQALMEFGALQCTPQRPKCGTCPFQASCAAYQTGRQVALPYKKRRLKIKQRFFHYLILHFEDRVYVKKREEKDIWQGLYDFYLVEESELLDDIEALNDPLAAALRPHKPTQTKSIATFVHQLTHQRLYMRFFDVYLDPLSFKDVEKILMIRKMVPHPANILDTLPFPKAIHRFFSLFS